MTIGNGFWLPLPPTSGSGAAWTQVLDENGSSIANWTVIGGTWSADPGGYIKQTDPAGAYRGLRLTNPVHGGAGLVMEAEIRFPTSAAADRRAMLAPSSSGSVSAVHDPWLGIGENTDRTVIQRGDQAAIHNAITVNEDVWYKTRVAAFGVATSLWVDGTQVATARIAGAGPVATPYAALICLSGETHFRNIKAWRLSGPA